MMGESFMATGEFPVQRFPGPSTPDLDGRPAALAHESSGPASVPALPTAAAVSPGQPA